jgi:hypothetical protein
MPSRREATFAATGIRGGHRIRDVRRAMKRNGIRGGSASLPHQIHILFSPRRALPGLIFSVPALAPATPFPGSGFNF